MASPAATHPAKLLRSLVRSPAVLAIIAVLVAVFAAQAVSADVAEQLALPGDTADLADRPWSPLTVMFLHENVLHLLVMVLMLAAFGMLLEQATSAGHVLAVYLLAGLAGSLAVLAALAVVEADGTLVGASAAVLGVAAAVLALRPSDRVLGGTATQWFSVLVAVNIVFLLSQPLGSVAHLTGLAVGAAYGRRLGGRVRAESGEFVVPGTTDSPD